MKKPLLSLMGSLVGILPFIFLPHASFAQTSSEIKLVTGNEVGEYYSIGKDMEKLGEKHNIDIDVIPTQGGLQNINDVFNYESIALGLVQGDVLAFLNIFANYDGEIGIKAESIRNVLPLFKEEIHVIARKDIKSLQDLAGKRVSIGEEGSGTSMTTSTLLYQLGINPKEKLVSRAMHRPQKFVTMLLEFDFVMKPISHLIRQIFFHPLPSNYFK